MTLDLRTAGAMITAVDADLDEGCAQAYHDQPLAQDWARTGKAIEEVGEAIGALIGLTGQNPRKGFTHSRADLLGELADISVTALLAIQHYTKDWDETWLKFSMSLAKAERRIGVRG